ncbi:MAG: TetR/AcrR family transcriptional regulator [Actinomycetota bacterium]|nr:TetR/AcrR family transcriptional regulator [Actinomycetota bacterium]
MPSPTIDGMAATGSTPSSERIPDDEQVESVGGSRREAGKQRNRQRLYDAALELFAGRGYDLVSVEDICERAGVGRATFFRLYGTKAGLLSEFNHRLAIRARHAVAAAQPADAGEALSVVARTMCATWAASGAALRELAQEYLQTVSVEAGARKGQPDLRALVTEIVAEGQRQRELVSRPGPEFISWMVVATISGAIATWLGTVETLNRRSDQALEVLLSGMRNDRR